MEWYLAVLKKYSRFRGRARRKEYWYFTLFNSLISLLLLTASSSISILSTESESLLLASLGSLLSLLQAAYVLGTIIPALAVMVRRLHDTGKSGWWYFIALIPIIGPIILFIFLCTDSEPGTNQYGANPK